MYQRTARIAYCAIIVLAIYYLVTDASGAEHLTRIALLPIQQDNVPAVLQISPDQFSDAFLVKMTRLPDFELIPFTDITEEIDRQLIDDAVFELLITNDLTATLAVLDNLETPTGRITQFCQTAHNTNVDYLIDITITPDRNNLHITYKLIDTKTSKCILAKSFYDAPNNPTETAAQIAKRLIRSLWQIKNNLSRSNLHPSPCPVVL